MVTVTWTRCGQVKAYADTIRWATITTDGETEDQVLAHLGALDFPALAKIRDENATQDGHCGWPHGLESYYSLKRTGEKVWQFKQTEPFCD